MDVNLKAVILGTNKAIKLIKEANQQGVVINTASLAGLAAKSGLETYCASKWGVVGFTLSTTEIGRKNNVRINCVCPGFVDTGMLSGIFEMRGGETDELRKQMNVLPVDVVARAYMRIIDDDTLEASAIVVNGKHTYKYSHDFSRIQTLPMDKNTLLYETRL